VRPPCGRGDGDATLDKLIDRAIERHRKSRLVAGTPVQALEDGKPVLSIRLTTNQTIVSGPGGYSPG
jgi:hypothetical protein